MTLSDHEERRTKALEEISACLKGALMVSIAIFPAILLGLFGLSELVSAIKALPHG